MNVKSTYQFLVLLLLLVLNACTLKSASTVDKQDGAKQNSNAAGDAEGFAGADAEGFAGIIAKIKSITIPSKVKIPKGTIIDMKVSDVVIGVEIKVSGKACTDVHIDGLNNLRCTLAEEINNLTLVIVSAKNPKSIETEYTPYVYVDADNDWVNDFINNPEVNCPSGVCSGPNCDKTDMCTVDNCPIVKNPAQSDDDQDGIGNLCDSDYVGLDLTDSYEYIDQVQGTYDTYMNPDDSSDRDTDGIPDYLDNCPDMDNHVNTELNMSDVNHNGIGDICDYGSDTDKDGIVDAYDNCPIVKNPDQEDLDGDGIGDLCDSISHPPAIVDSFIAASKTSLPVGSTIVLNGSGFITGARVNLIWNYYNYVSCTVKSLSITRLTCELELAVNIRGGNAVNDPVRVRVANPGGAWFDYYPSFLE